MPANVPQARETLARMMQQQSHTRVLPEELELIASGASGRCLMRAAGMLGIYWTAERADNAAFPAAAAGLAQAGIPVPALLATADLEDGCGACIVEDLGSVDLLSLRDAPWEQRRAAYDAALIALHRFHGVAPDWPLQPPFDAALYRWEHEYFAEHLIARHLGGDAAAFLAAPALTDMAEWLASLPRCPIHRDCQSQNIMLRGRQAFFIDFQGMRMGRPEYDFASLLYDPYMALHPVECEELLRDWESREICATPTDPAVFCACALQRLMQALGAFANIGYNQKRQWYLDLIPTGLDTLRRVAQRALNHEKTAPAASCPLTAM